jgi:hypothetical protein
LIAIGADHLHVDDQRIRKVTIATGKVTGKVFSLVRIFLQNLAGAQIGELRRRTDSPFDPEYQNSPNPKRMS